MIIGDESFSNLLLGSNIMADEEYFKVAKPGATIHNTISNALYFINNLLSGLTNVIIQIGYADTKSGKSEKIKKELKWFIQLMNELSIKVVICGPIPYSRMSNEAFSRAYNLNMWLLEQVRFGSGSFALIDCFDLMWGNKDAFLENRTKLSRYGNWLIESVIEVCITGSD